MLSVFSCVWRPVLARAARWFARLLCIGAIVSTATAQTSVAARWKYATTGEVSSPAVDREGNIYVGVSERSGRGRLLALTRTGALKWPEQPESGLPLPHAVEAAPAIGPNGEIFFGSTGGIFYAFSAGGTKLWDYSIGGSVPIIFSSPAIAGDFVYFNISDGDLSNPSGTILAFTTNGLRVWSKRVDGVIRSSLAVAPDGTLCFAADDGYVYAVHPDGREKWSRSTREPNQPAETKPIFSSPAIAADGTVYIGAGTNSLYALAPADGAVKWRFPAGRYIAAPPAIGADGTVYVGSLDGYFYAIDPGTGAKKWEYRVGQQIWSGAVVRGDGSIIFGADIDDNFHGHVIALMPADDGKSVSLLWKYETDDAVLSSPVVDHEGNIYVGSLDTRLHALSGNGSPLSAFSAWPAFQRDAQRTARSAPHYTGGRLINLSTRALAGPGSELIAGFVVQGVTTKYYLVRGVGPALADFGVAAPLPDPTITVFAGGTPHAFNNDWGDAAPPPGPSAATETVGAFPLPVGSKDAAVVPLLAPGDFTAQVDSRDERSGTALAEIYDARPDATGSTLLNLSARARLTSNTELISGLVVGGTEPVRVLVRAVGPSLRQFQLSELLMQPMLRVIRQSDQAVLHTSRRWTDGGFRGDMIGAGALAGAFKLDEPTANGADSALIATLAPGDYSIRVVDQAGVEGRALVEVYLLP